MNWGKKIGFFTAFLIPIAVIAGYYLGSAWNYLTVSLTFFVIPLLDIVFGKDIENIPNDKVRLVSQDFFYSFVLYCWVYFQLAFVLWGVYVVTIGVLHYWWEWLGFTVSFALVTGGVGITVAHELGHKKSRLERLYSKTLLMMVCYMHFYIEHNRGHHVHVATPEDPATAKRGETFYAFWVRSVFYGYLHAWKLENQRLRRKKLPVISMKNEMIIFTVLPVIFCSTLTLGASLYMGQFVWQVPTFFFVQSLLAFTLLEQVNYIEHYGILRKEIQPGGYEKVKPIHSWNASQVVSNFFLFQLQRHSDHHANAIKRYQVLQHYDESPQLPTGYSAMIILCLVPPLWFNVMDKRLEIWTQNNLTST
ncbi:alkane 1-monooxygenase [Fulvivirga sp. M361]|uniref:alkane 1-monooxygenase n=1 Tax=Fulvivirga sp. M361 TaxID=2594266 RepID=UPI00117BC60D|nr:alkane 1-monooxygenase [Fulvivirga sp. M361]TRX62146.1 alkane 1-monooxygenase [Fulvivirga sp. M361]